MKKRMKTYYGWFPVLFLLTLFCCLPKTVSALRASQPQETPPVVEAAPEPAAPQEPETASAAEATAHRPDKTPASQPENTAAETITQTPEETQPDTTETPETQQPEQMPQETPEDIPQQEPDEAPEDPPAGSGETPPQEASPESMDSFFSDTLFIGDSRTVGLCEYSGLTTATFFSDVGMSVYKVLVNEVSVPGSGQTTLEKLLQEKTFGKVHLMLGINELGYDLTTTVTAYADVVATIRTLQPDAVIYVGANLHVGKYRSDTDTVINNPAIDRFNNAVAALADGETIFYVDVNPLFDDEEGNLRADFSGDGTHVYGSCYPQWAQWLYTAMQTGE